MAAQPDRRKSAAFLTSEEDGCENGKAQVMGQIQHLQPHAHLVHGRVYGGCKGRVEAAQIHGGSRQLVIPPHGCGIAFYQFEESLHDGFFKAVSCGHAVAATPADVAAAFLRIKIVGKGAGDQTPALLCQRPGRRPVDRAPGIIRIRNIRRVSALPPGFTVSILLLAEAHQLDG
ncbi:MAG: hypothetical protein A4E72_00624 [Syntrophus sp. PtaU1.Bin208]|nr:MAG: hypothetical protein A4E72_00624 [Syntrophus sp. PtaU1.Bin208]